MNVSRRQMLGLGAAGAAALLCGCESLEQRLTTPGLSADAFAPGGSAHSPERCLLNRIAYGPRPGDLARLARQGIPAFVDEQLRPESIAEDPLLLTRLRPLRDVLDADTGTLFDMDDRQVVSVLRQATLLRALYSRRQLLERMTEFWNDHFNIYVYKGEGAQLKVADNRSAIRAHALGYFRDLLGASARSAAMLGYLDNASNGRGRPNENYARELMELHTLGVHGGYTQRDVQEVARCLTGWTSERHWHRGRFSFDAARHDDGAKHVLGTTLPAGGGSGDGERILDLLAAHPATARHLSRKLCRHFLGAEPAALTASLAATFQKSEGDIKAVLRVLLLSPEIEAAPLILKRPFDYAVSALRAFNADTDGGPALQDHLEKMGQPLFAWPMPDGFPDRASAWIGGLLPRWNFALALAGGQIADTIITWDALAQAGRRKGMDAHAALRHLALEGVDPSGLLSRMEEKFSGPAEYGAMLLMSPEFQWR